MQEFFKKFHLSNKETMIKLVTILGLVGIGLILLSQMISQDKEQVVIQQELTSQQYIEQTEQKLLGLLQSVEGVGKAKVMVTLESGVEYVYASEDKTSTDTNEDANGSNDYKIQEKNVREQKIVMVDTGSGSNQALVQTSIEPVIKGVVVVCSGGDDVLVRQAVTDVITTAFRIGANKVCVSKLDQAPTK